MKLTTDKLTKYYLVIKKKEFADGETSEILYVSMDKSLLKQKIKEFKHQGGHHPSTEIDVKTYKSWFLKPNPEKIYGIFANMGKDHFPLLMECINNKEDFEQAEKILKARGHTKYKMYLKQLPLVKSPERIK